MVRVDDMVGCSSLITTWKFVLWNRSYVMEGPILLVYYCNNDDNLSFSNRRICQMSCYVIGVYVEAIGFIWSNCLNIHIQIHFTGGMNQAEPVLFNLAYHGICCMWLESWCSEFYVSIKYYCYSYIVASLQVDTKEWTSCLIWCFIIPCCPCTPTH